MEAQPNQPRPAQAKRYSEVPTMNTKRVPLELLKVMASQKLTRDMSADELNDSDFETAYDILVENSRTLLNAAPSPVEPDACEWREDQDGNWFAKCGASWTFEHDGPDENGMKFCYCCGKTLLPIAFQQYVEPESLAQLSLETKFSPEAKAELDADPLFGPRVLKNAQNAAVAMRLSEVIERWQTDQISSDEAMIELCSITHLLEHPNVINPSTNSSQISSKLVEPEAHAQTIIKERGEHYAALLLKALEEAL